MIRVYTETSMWIFLLRIDCFLSKFSLGELLALGLKFKRVGHFLMGVSQWSDSPDDLLLLRTLREVSDCGEPSAKNVFDDAIESLD